MKNERGPIRAPPFFALLVLSQLLRHLSIRRWTLQTLAEEAGCSRAVFAQRCHALVGQGAIGYLTA